MLPSVAPADDKDKILWEAAGKGDIERLKLLIQAQADLNWRNPDRVTPCPFCYPLPLQLDV
jgi:hypothetical protein